MEIFPLRFFLFSLMIVSLILLFPPRPSQGAEYPFSFSFGSLGKSNGSFDQPYDISINNTGFIFVADTNNNRIQIFDSSGNWKQSFGSFGSGNGQFQYPDGVAVNNTGFIYVDDKNNHRIQIFDPSGNWKKIFGSSGSGNGQFQYLNGIAINNTGFVFASGADLHGIQIFDSSGNWKESFGSFGSGNGQFQYPAGIDINSTGFIFVADPYNNRIQVFDSSGNWKQSYDSFSTNLYKFNLPYGVAVNRTGFIFVADTDNNQIKALGIINGTNSQSHLNSQGGTLVSNTTLFNGASHKSATSSQVTFTETGLPAGVGFCWPFWNCVPNWSVIINNHTQNATTNTISLAVTSGTYPYSIVSPRGYMASPSSGGLLVQGPTKQEITFQISH